MIYISYTRNDERYRDELEVQLKRAALGSPEFRWWDVRDIRPGQVWQKEMSKVLDSCTVALLLVSANYLASDFIVKNELAYLLYRTLERKNLRLFWVLLSPCLWKDTHLADLQPIGSADRTVSEMTEADRRGFWANKVIPVLENGLNNPNHPNVQVRGIEDKSSFTNQRVSTALNVWKDKLEFLLSEEAVCSNAAQQFTISMLIKEAKDKIAQLEDESR